MGLLSFFRPSFHHGIHPAQHKDTGDAPIRRLPFAERLVIPLGQHIGKPARPIVHRGQEVVRGEPIAEADGFLSVPIHAPATGTIRGIELAPTARGPKADAILLDVLHGSSQEVLYGAPQDLDALSREELVRAVQETGMVGLGGAAFPTHAKMTMPDGHHVDTVLVNGCECEPYLTTDHRVMLEDTENLIKGVRIAMRATGAERALIGVEDNKMDAVEAIRAKLPADDSMTVHALRTKYPQGAEKMVIKALTGREVPSGGLPSAVGVSVFNVASLAQLGTLMPRGQGLIERVVTVTGPAIERPGNYLVPLGTPIRFVLDTLGRESGPGSVVLGGPMMGSAIASLDVPVTKGTSGILVFRHAPGAEHLGRQVQPCIKCGRCVEACPLSLNPSQLGLLAAKREYDAMAEQYHLFDCFECGSCSYVCPSYIPLVQYFRIAKAILRERSATR
ncbi:MAG: electron transport complex subunit RsxC [Gammaproteobacteria bacterium]|nr:electron transport complex subunit RsxC [Gammaproteobacteria bacterium]MDJ0872902.1 electron transport complex subunit RsxC [Gammaproteobacteria bacterium]